MTKAFIVDEFCDFLDPNKICDNCGACLNLSKADLHAIKIEEISKNIDENSVVEADLEEAIEEVIDIPNWEELIEKAKKIDPTMTQKEIEDALKSTYIKMESSNTQSMNSEYDLEKIEEILNEEEASEEVIYLEDLDLIESDLEEDTEEVFPGLRRLKTKK